jgi:hypothetical protein
VAERIAFGRYAFEVEGRPFDGAGGLTLHVYGTRAGKSEEVLRFDCFAREPHYHLGWSYFDDPFIPIPAADPLVWALCALRDEFATLLRRADADPPHASELSDLPQALARLGQVCEELRRLRADRASA